MLGARKEAGRERQDVECTLLLDVDPDLALASNRDQGEVAGMRG
jgi:hypothetical protein